MAGKRVGTITCWRKSSPNIGIFRMIPESGHNIPFYKAGQYMALQRNDCRLTKKVVRDDKKIEYVTILCARDDPKGGRSRIATSLPPRHRHSRSEVKLSHMRVSLFLTFFDFLDIDLAWHMRCCGFTRVIRNAQRTRRITRNIDFP